MNCQWNLPSINSPDFDNAVLSQRYSPIISLSVDANSDDTETFQVEVGFRDEGECCSVLEPLANQHRCSFMQQFGFQEMRITVPQSFAIENHQLCASPAQKSVTTDGHSLRLEVNTGEIKILLDAIEHQVVDIMAICSESGKLRNIVLTAAGTAICEEYHRESTGVQKSWLETPPGLLKCQKVVYYEKGMDEFNFLLTIFVKTWMKCAYENNYQSIVAKITLKSSSSNQSDLKKCRLEMETVCESTLIKSVIKNISELCEWTQSTIQDYFKFCVWEKQVLPKMDITEGSVELKGTAADVEKCKTYFHELNSNLLNQARKIASAQGVVWSYLHPETNQWIQYPIELNVEIEDAYKKRLPVFYNLLININFEKMIEIQSNRSIQVRRREINPAVPITWDMENDNGRKRIPLKFTSIEYVQVLKQFDAANMKGKYTEIRKIERIQNERWFLQYSAHRDAFKQRSNGSPYEKSLFHGCTDVAVDSIINENFNRAYAGVNGIAYGNGCYFSASAKYSHNFAIPNSFGERHMFLAKVLTGKSTIGNPSMKVPPTGYDSTTDGRNIFVTYHDAQAYAEYLIVYK
ncbi:unnamed protein product [Rotaria socialis]|uniref:Poly [ADP-ribose] polymerase n=2 Tax=Rotaria socialis TaxID=392032 RepID=A0A818VSU4_9BILA|nr:unnamed protein product [Rotaria socialis]